MRNPDDRNGPVDGFCGGSVVRSGSRGAVGPLDLRLPRELEGWVKDAKKTVTGSGTHPANLWKSGNQLLVEYWSSVRLSSIDSSPRYNVYNIQCL